MLLGLLHKKTLDPELIQKLDKLTEDRRGRFRSRVVLGTVVWDAKSDTWKMSEEERQAFFDKLENKAYQYFLDGLNLEDTEENRKLIKRGLEKQEK